MCWRSTDSIGIPGRCACSVPGGWNGLRRRIVERNIHRLFAVAAAGSIIIRSLVLARAFALPGVSYALPDSSHCQLRNLPTRLRQCHPVPDKLGMCLYSIKARHADSLAAQRRIIEQTHHQRLPGLHSNNGIAAVVAEPEQVELFRDWELIRKIWGPARSTGRPTPQKFLPPRP